MTPLPLGVRHRITPLILVYRDGFTLYRCLSCGRPVARHGSWHHYRHPEWKPGAGK